MLPYFLPFIKFAEQIDSCVGAVVIKLAYGENLHQTHGQELIKLNTEALSLVTWAFGKPWLPNFIPISEFTSSHDLQHKLTFN